MRVTKKMLREVKKSLQKRLSELALMNDQQIVEELKRCFPQVESGTCPPADARKWLIVDLVELAIPTHWCD